MVEIKSNINLISKLISSIILILLVFTPIHNVIIVFGINVLGFSAWIALWKEFCILGLVILMLSDLLKNIKNFNLKHISNLWILGLFFCLNLSAILSSFVFNKTQLQVFAFGYRFEILWLWLWVVGFIWVSNISKIYLKYYKKTIIKGIFAGFSLCIMFSLGQLFLGSSFVRALGYTDSSIQIGSNKIYSPICHTIDFGVDTCRLAAPFSSPNHLAGYLLLILGFMLFYSFQTGESIKLKKYFSNLSFEFKLLTNLINPVSWFSFIKYFITNFVFLNLSFIISLLILFTYSRFAFIGLLIIWVGVLVFFLIGKYQKYIISIFTFCVVLFAILISGIDPNWSANILPSFLSKPSSSAEHYRLTGVSFDIIKSDPNILINGLGQGSSGSSTKYFEPDQNIIFNRFKDISYKWFIKPERISVPENWYLQLVLNGGLLYTILYLFILLYPFLYILKVQNNNNFAGIIIVFLGFTGLLVGNTFLHLWENQTIAIYWSLIYIWLYVETQRR